MEIIDRAQQEIERELERSIAKARAQESRYRPIGICLYCSEPLAKGLRWCDADCRDDFFKYDVEE